MSSVLVVLAEWEHQVARVGLRMTVKEVGESRRRQTERTVCRGWVDRCMRRSQSVGPAIPTVGVRCLGVDRAAGGDVTVVVGGSEERLLRTAPSLVFGPVGMKKPTECLVCRIYNISRLLGRRTIPPAIRSAVEGAVLVEETAGLLDFVEGTAAAAAAETEIEEMWELAAAGGSLALSRGVTSESDQQDYPSPLSCPCPS